MKRLLFVMDRSEIAGPSLALSLNLARGLRASLSILRVTDPVLKELDAQVPYDHKAEVAAIAAGKIDRQLAEAMRAALRVKVACRPLVSSGDVCAAIMAEADEADMIIIGRKGPGATLAYGMSDAIAESFLRQVPVPVVMAGKQTRRVRNILVAFDGQHGSLKAMSVILNLAVFWRGDPLIPRVLCVGSDTETQAIAEQAQKLADARSVKIGMIRDTGTPEEAIVRVVEEKEIDLLAMGVYSKTPLHQRLFGSVTRHLLSAVECSMLACH
ncbi:MAG TPA: universal stress protein [bacterium]|nr:universal stress protein [bacterium]HQL62888.1 universal stress protein [bacterium]